MDEAELAHHRRCQDKGIEVRLAHAVVKAVDRVGERQPCCNQRIEVVLAEGSKSISISSTGLRPALGRTRKPKAAAVSNVSTMCK